MNNQSHETLGRLGGRPPGSRPFAQLDRGRCTRRPESRRSARGRARSGALWQIFGVLVLVVCGVLTARAMDAEAPVADRTAIEHVYYAHRLGNKPPFEVASPPSLIQRLVDRDRGKEQVLKKVYGVEITDAAIAAEVERIDRTTQAPEMLAEIRAALGGDPHRFARACIKPILVDRELRARFENDAVLHAGNRLACAAVRRHLLAALTNGASPAQLLAAMEAAGSNHVTEITWQLAPPPVRPADPTNNELEIPHRFGAQARMLSAPETPGAEIRPYFSELPDGLQRVLRLQLRRAGDISAVIESPAGFSLYLAESRTTEILSVAVLLLPKRDYNQWVEEEIHSPDR